MSIEANTQENNMTKWKHTLNIKQFLSSDTSNEAIVKAAERIVHELGKLPFDDRLEELQYEFVDISQCEPEDDGYNDLLDHFNYTLDLLYDYADENRIWMGL